MARTASGNRPLRAALFRLAAFTGSFAALTTPGWLFAEGAGVAPGRSPTSPSLSQRAVAPSRSYDLPLYFVENRGQLNGRVAYYLQGASKVFYFTAEGLTLVLHGPEPQRWARAEEPTEGGPTGGAATPAVSRHTLKLDFIGARPEARPAGAEPAAARFHYFKGPRSDWITGLRSYQRLVYADVWPGIDLIYSGSVNRLKYQFVVKPGADPKRIKLRYRGADSIALDSAGRLRVRTPLEDFHDERPTAHQEADGAVIPVAASYALESSKDGDHSYGFRIGAYDPGKTLIIDPAILVYAGFIGGSGDDRGNGIAVDSDGNSYVTGETSSTHVTGFPTRTGPDTTQNGAVDAFVAKVDPTGTRLVYAGFIGGSGDDRGKAIAVDSLGSAYVAGETNSGQATFPVTTGPDLVHNGALDAFIAKIDPAGDDLVYAGYIGGLGNDRGMGIALDSSNRAYVTGDTESGGASFPDGNGFGGLTTFNSNHSGAVDAFVARVAADGESLEYASYIGGGGTDRGAAIAVDGSGRAYVTGETDSGAGSFPDGNGFDGLTSFDNSQNGGVDAFVARVAADGASLEYAGYIGGAADDRGKGIAVDGAGAAYVTGETSSNENTFPDGDGIDALPGPGQTRSGGVDGFAAKVNAAGTALVYAGYIGGANDDRGNAIALMPGCASDCEVYIAGETSSTQSSFPVSVGPDLTHNGGMDAFLAKVNAGGSLGMAGYLGGSGDDRGKAVAVDAAGDVYLAGETNSTQGSFPTKSGPDTTQNLGVDAFAAKICVTTCADLSLAKSDAPDPVTVGSNITYTLTVTNNGPDGAANVELTDVLPSSVTLVSATPSAGSCAGTTTIVCALGTLANGASETVTIVVTATAAGNITNAASVASDATETAPSDNDAVARTVVTLPDLAVKSLSAAAAVIPGTAINVTDTTVNKGKVAAASSTTRFFLSTDSKFDAGDVDLSASRSIGPLAPKQSDTGSTMVTIPPATAPGKYFLIGVADADSAVSETKEKNSRAKRLTVALPDLTVQSLKAPSSAAAGAGITIEDTTGNNAPVAAGASTTNFYLSTDSIFDGGDVPLGSRGVGALAAKGKSSGATAVTIPLATAPGNYFILAVSDAGAAVDEVDEGNNPRAKSITVTP
jgi:uncharacterized repeat protein (TIGR01451 family)